MARTTSPAKRAASGTAKRVVSLKVTLCDIKPPVWRQILMSGDSNLYDVHMAIQVTMGWMDSHLHAFNIDGKRYSDPRAMEDYENEDRLKLTALIKSGITKFRYVYDFGDNWEHDVAIEEAPSANSATLPTCVAGARHCPPEDCGGPWGYEELVAVLADPAHPDHGEQKEWIGEDFDPEYFSLSDADAMLAKSFRRKTSARG
jgi:hypothetical protein